MILIDNRTGSAELSPLLFTPKLLCRLEFADFAWSGNGPNGTVNVGVERKALRDLLNSITTGRLSGHQMVGLMRDYDWVYLVVEGVWRPKPNSGILQQYQGKKWIDVGEGQNRITVRHLYNFLNSLSIMCGVRIIHTGLPQDTAVWLDSNYKWWQKKWKSHRAHLQFHDQGTPAHLERPSLVARVAAQFDGIRWGRAKALGKRFDVLGLMKASEDELMGVEGIGRGLAKSIIKQRDGDGK